MAHHNNVQPGQLVLHEQWGIGLVLNVEGRGRRRQAAIDFGDQVAWIVLADTPLTCLGDATDRRPAPLLGVGWLVSHPYYGAGLVISVDDARALIEFQQQPIWFDVADPFIVTVHRGSEE